MQTETLELTIIDRSIDTFKSGSEILLANQQRSAKAITVGNNIIDAIAANGMTPELDLRAQTFLVNCAKASGEMNENRAAITQIMDEIKKLFTAEENKLDVKKEGSIPAQIQAHRNAFARKMAEEAKERVAKAEREAKQATEAIDLKASIENKLFEFYQSTLIAAKSRMQKAFNEVTLETAEQFRTRLQNFIPSYSIDMLFDFKFSAPALYHSPSLVIEFANEIRNNKWPEYQANYIAELSLLKMDLLDTLPSKIAELCEQKKAAEIAEKTRLEEVAKQAESERIRKEQIAAANAEEKIRLEKQAEIDRKAEAEKLEQIKRDVELQKELAEKQQRDREIQQQIERDKEAEQARKDQELKSEINKQGATTLAMFEQTAASVSDSPAPETRTGCEIIVSHQAGYVQLFTMWFEKEGLTLPIEKIEKTSFLQIKTWAEKHAMKTSEKIESKFITYQDTYKAVNRKAKPE